MTSAVADPLYQVLGAMTIVTIVLPSQYFVRDNTKSYSVYPALDAHTHTQTHTHILVNEFEFDPHCVL